MATSVDGYIARPDGDVAWLDRPRPKGNYGMGEFQEHRHDLVGTQDVQ